MRFEEFKSGTYRRQFQYKSFSPSPINEEWSWEDPRINALLEEGSLAVAELNAFSLIVPDVDLFTSMHVVKEASTSSKIEGTVQERVAIACTTSHHIMISSSCETNGGQPSQNIKRNVFYCATR